MIAFPDPDATDAEARIVAEAFAVAQAEFARATAEGETGPPSGHPESVTRLLNPRTEAMFLALCDPWTWLHGGRS